LQRRCDSQLFLSRACAGESPPQKNGSRDWPNVLITPAILYCAARKSTEKMAFLSFAILFQMLSKKLRRGRHTSNKTLLISDAQMKEIFIISARLVRMHPDSPAAQESQEEKQRQQTTEQLFFQTFLLSISLCFSLSLFHLSLSRQQAKSMAR